MKAKPNSGKLLGSDIWRRRNVTMFQPLHTDILLSFRFWNTIQIGHEDEKASLRRHTGIAVHELFL
jgi:hypothetical protein